MRSTVGLILDHTTQCECLSRFTRGRRLESLAEVTWSRRSGRSARVSNLLLA